MIHNADNFRPEGGDRAGRGVIRAAIVIAITTSAALPVSLTNAHAGVREITKSSYGFANSAWTSNGLSRPAQWPFGSGGAQQCFVNCGPVFGASVVRRSDLLTSNTADLSARKAVDANGHALGVGGTVVVERLESDALGSLANWVVVSERTIDENGSHSWSLPPNIPSDAPWAPSSLYRFEGSSFSVDLTAGTSATPEASTWAMMLMGFSAFAFARYRNSRICRFSTPIRKGAHI